MALINCFECNAQISDSAVSCPHCGAPVIKPQTESQQCDISTKESCPEPKPVCPENHLVKAVLVTIFCCWPIGIPAIVNAAEVSSAFLAGNYELAEEKSKAAEKWCGYCITAGVIFYALYLVIVIIAAVVGEL